MPVQRTKDWAPTGKSDLRNLTAGGLTFPVFISPFKPPNSSYCLVTPATFLKGGKFQSYLALCKQKAAYDPDKKTWVWPIDAVTTHIDSPIAPPVVDKRRTELAAAWKKKQDETASKYLSLSAQENIPEESWPDFVYPDHYVPRDPAPTPLQRILVSRYWDKEYATLAASVGMGKSRMAIDTLNARATANNLRLNNSTRIVLLIAPKSIHVNWRREFDKWTPKGGPVWTCMEYAPTEKFAATADAAAAEIFDNANPFPGGIVIITSPQVWSRPNITAYFKKHNIHPTFILVDEAQRCFRNPRNKSYSAVSAIRADALGYMALTGTPANTTHDYWGLEDIAAAGHMEAHWKSGTYEEYRSAFDPDYMLSSRLWSPGWNDTDIVREYHSFRIVQGDIFCAHKEHYMAASLPGLDQEELGSWSDMRLAFYELMQEDTYVEAAIALDREKSGEDRDAAYYTEKTSHAITLLLRMRQVAAASPEKAATLDQWVSFYLEDDEPAVIWCQFVDEILSVASRLATYGKVATLYGETKDRQLVVDGFQNGTTRFLVAHPEAAGIGLNMHRARYNMFHSIPISYIQTTQAIGRLHRIGQTREVTSYFIMDSPVDAFLRRLFDHRCEMNEAIPRNLK